MVVFFLHLLFLSLFAYPRLAPRENFSTSFLLSLFAYPRLAPNGHFSTSSFPQLFHLSSPRTQWGFFNIFFSSAFSLILASHPMGYVNIFSLVFSFAVPLHNPFLLRLDSHLSSPRKKAQSSDNHLEILVEIMIHVIVFHSRSPNSKYPIAANTNSSHTEPTCWADSHDSSPVWSEMRSFL